MSFLPRYHSGVVELLMALREVVLEEAPEATETIGDVDYTTEGSVAESSAQSRLWYVAFPTIRSLPFHSVAARIPSSVGLVERENGVPYAHLARADNRCVETAQPPSGGRVITRLSLRIVDCSLDTCAVDA
jgi:hypothetical protein